MKYSRNIVLKNGKEACLRSAEASDAEAVMETFRSTHGETDYLLSYPDESRMDVEREQHFLEEKAQNDREAEIIVVVDGQVVGTAGIDAVGTRYKVRHRAEFGISVSQAYWELGIGTALTEACIACARAAGYAQLELTVVADNRRAVALYEKEGFVEYGRNPKGFCSRVGGYQEVIYMRLEL